MKRIRIGASILGILFGILYALGTVGLFLTNSIGGGLTLSQGEMSVRSQCLLLLFAPFSLIVATVVAWKRSRLAGWWLTIGAVAMAILIRVKISPDVVGNVTYAAAIYSLPMLAAGLLWLKDASKTKPGNAPPRNLP